MKKFLSVFLALLISSLSFDAFALEGSDLSQQHIIDDYENVYKSYESEYLCGCGKALDGTDGNPDICVPGLCAEDNMVPQGLTFWEDENCYLISAYSYDKTKPSTVYAVDAGTGDYKGEFRLYNSETEKCMNHVGGIAVSENNLYVATGSSISYVPLETLETYIDTSSDVILCGSKEMGTDEFLGNGAVSYLSYSEGVLWTGNYYSGINPTYNTKATEYSSVIIGLRLAGDNEWENLSAIHKPTYKVNVPELLQDIQCATYSDGKLIIGTSHGSLLDSSLIICDIDLTENGTDTLTSCGMKLYSNMPMSEGIFVKDGYLYNLFESGADKFVGAKPNFSRNPTDVVWKVDLNALENNQMDIISFVRVELIKFSGLIQSFVSGI